MESWRAANQHSARPGWCDSMDEVTGKPAWHGGVVQEAGSA